MNTVLAVRLSKNMSLEGKLDIHLISADLSRLVSDEEELTTNVKIVIDDITVGSSVVETGPQPEWREKFSVEVASMSELRAELYSHADTELQGGTLVGRGLTRLADLRFEANHNQPLKYTLELRPKGQILLEVTFHPRQIKLETGPENNHHHRGHKYNIFSFCDVVKCAFCQVSTYTCMYQQIFTSSEIFFAETDGWYF